MKTVNDYIGLTDNDRIEAAIADRENGIVILPPRKSEIEPERDFWLLDRAIILPENTTFILQNCKIKLSDKCRDNFFRSSNCGIGIEDVGRISNIQIKGEGYCLLEGADHPRATGDSSKILSCPCPKKPEDILKYADWITPEQRESGKLGFWDVHSHSYGTDAGKDGENPKGDWRGIGILLACVDNFAIEGLHMADTHGWAISCEDCAYGRIEKIDFDMCMEKKIDGMLHNMENQDGIDLRNGCHDIIIENITGGTGDDIIALTAIANRSLPIHPSGMLKSMHILHNDWDRRDTDIHDVIIRNVKGWSKGGVCFMIRLLPVGAKIRNVVIDGVIDTAPEGKMAGGMLWLGEPDGAYGKNPIDGLRFISISNIICKSRRAIAVDGYLSDSVITNVINRNPDCEAISVTRENGLVNVLISNIVTVEH